MPKKQRACVRPTKLDSFTQSYIETALWSSTDESDERGGEPLDRNYSTSDISCETLRKMVADAKQFQRKNKKFLDESGLSDSKAGNDFWLSRNGAGAGFFDHYPEVPHQDDLQEASRKAGSFDLYVGDDGEIYGS